MKLTGLTFGPGPEGEALPNWIAVEMTRDEALLIVTMIGGTSPLNREGIMPLGGQIGSDIYDCLIGDVFNRYWEDGANDARRERHA